MIVFLPPLATIFKVDEGRLLLPVCLAMGRAEPANPDTKVDAAHRAAMTIEGEKKLTQQRQLCQRFLIQTQDLQRRSERAGGTEPCVVRKQYSSHGTKQNS